MHFHGVHYRPSSDGAYVPGFSGKDGNVKFGRKYTYRLTAGRDSVGVWPYHDHSPSMEDSIHGGMFGMLSIFGRHERLPDREFQVVFSPFGEDFMAINGRAFIGNTPIYRSRVGQRVQWDVMAMGSDHHTFHVHGHRWRTRAGDHARHPDRRPRRELPLPLARARPRHVALPLPRRGPHDARHDRAVPRQAPMRAALAVVLAAAARWRWRRPHRAPVPVNIEFQAFSPTPLDVLPGETVEWDNISSRAHTVTADDESFDSGDIEAGDRFERTFDAVGAHDYHCRIHPGMVGELDVRRVILGDPADRARPGRRALRRRRPHGRPVVAGARSSAASATGFETGRHGHPGGGRDMARGAGRRADRRIPRARRRRREPDAPAARQRPPRDRARTPRPGLGQDRAPEPLRARHARAAPARAVRLVAAALQAARLPVTRVVPGQPARPARVSLVDKDGWTRLAISPVVRIRPHA